MNRLILACLVGTLFGCAASVPMAPQNLNIVAKEFRPPASDQANIYVYRDQWMGYALKTVVGVDNLPVSVLGPRTFAVFTVPPGQHTIVSQVDREHARLSLFVQGGSNVFVKQELYGRTYAGPATRLNSMDEIAGEKGVSSCELVTSSRMQLPPTTAPSAPAAPLIDIKPIAAGTETLAVLEFQARNIDQDSLTAFADEIRGGATSGLSGRGIDVMTRENVLVLLKDRGKGDCVEGDCDLETARNLKADYVLSGRIDQGGQGYVLTMRLLETKLGKQMGIRKVEAASEIELKRALHAAAQALVVEAFADRKASPAPPTSAPASAPSIKGGENQENDEVAARYIHQGLYLRISFAAGTVSGKMSKPSGTKVSDTSLTLFDIAIGGTLGRFVLGGVVQTHAATSPKTTSGGTTSDFKGNLKYSLYAPFVDYYVTESRRIHVGLAAGMFEADNSLAKGSHAWYVPPVGTPGFAILPFAGYDYPLGGRWHLGAGARFLYGVAGHDTEGTSYSVFIPEVFISLLRH